MGEPEVLDGLERHLEPLLGYPNLFWVEHPSFYDHDGRPRTTKRRKERSIEAAIEGFRQILEEGNYLYLRSAMWQHPYEIFGVRTEGFLVTQFALMVRSEATV